MQFEPDKISSYYHSSSKPSFFFYRTAVITSMVVLLTVLGINLYNINQTTQTQSHASYSSSDNTLLPSLAAGCAYKKTPQGSAVVCDTSTPAHAEPTGITQQGEGLPPLPPQCHYENRYQNQYGKTPTYDRVITCTEGRSNCTYTIVNNKFIKSCDK